MKFPMLAQVVPLVYKFPSRPEFSREVIFIDQPTVFCLRPVCVETPRYCSPVLSSALPDQLTLLCVLSRSLFHSHETWGPRELFFCSLHSAFCRIRPPSFLSRVLDSFFSTRTFHPCASWAPLLLHVRRFLSLRELKLTAPRFLYFVPF